MSNTQDFKEEPVNYHRKLSNRINIKSMDLFQKCYDIKKSELEEKYFSYYLENYNYKDLETKAGRMKFIEFYNKLGIFIRNLADNTCKKYKNFHCEMDWESEEIIIAKKILHDIQKGMYDKRKKSVAYLQKSINNAIIDFYKRETAEKRDINKIVSNIVKDTNEDEIDIFELVVCKKDDIEEIYMEKEIKSIYEEFLSGLNDFEKSVFVGYEQNEEIAEKYGKSGSTVSRTKKKLYDVLEKTYNNAGYEAERKKKTKKGG